MTHSSPKNILIKTKLSVALAVKLSVVLVIMFSSLIGSSANWYDLNWLYRRAVTVTNPGTIPLYNFQVQIKLDNTFDFTKAQPGGSDIRVTADDGTTLIPFWIETWDATGLQATIWIKLATIPTSGTSIYFYYGNSATQIPPPVLIESPPTGPFTRVGANPIVFTGGGAGKSLLAENIVYDPVTNHYWMCMANYTDLAVSLCWSDDPTNPSSWHWFGNVISSSSFFSIAPHLVFDNGNWYLFYSDLPNIKVAFSTSVTGPYTIKSTPALERSGHTWDSKRVDEPYVFKRADGKWVMVYMGDAGSAANNTYIEQDGYATADSAAGPYIAYSGNPCITFGPTGSYDAGTIADPWVYYFKGVYYIGHSSSATTEPPWLTAQVTTTDWVTFTKHGIISPGLTSGWDYPNAFRGAVIRIGNTYLLSYTGAGLHGSGLSYSVGLATQPVYFDPSTIINNGDAVFDFFDGFSGSSLDLTKWSIQYPSQAYLGNGQLTLEATGYGVYNIMHSKTLYGPGYIAETRAMHPNQGTFNQIIEVGFADDFWNTVRIVDDYSLANTTYWQRQARLSSGDDSNITNMAQNADKNWHIFHVGRNVENIAAFQIDNNPVETIQGTNVTNRYLPTYLMSYPNGSVNQLVADWTRVRKWVGTDPSTTVGTEEAASGLLCQWSGNISSDWSDPGNWTALTVPQSYSLVTIPFTIIKPQPHITSSTTSPAECKDLTINSGSVLTIEAGKAINVHGTITNNAGSAGLIIKSDATGTGSLINSSLNVPATVERYVSGGWNTWNSGWHLISSPVANQAITGFTTSGTGNDYDFYAWYENWNLWMNYKDPSFANINSGLNFNVGQGYLISYQLTQSGKYFSGNINVSNVAISNMSLSSGVNYSWHLLGNPYSSPLKWNDGNWALNNIAGNAKIWNESGMSYSDIPANGTIPTAQGFMVSVGSSTNNITIPAASRIHSNTAWYKSVENKQILLLASEQNNNSFQESRLEINQSSTSGFDFNYDSRFLAGYAPQFYSICGDEMLSTNSLPSITEGNKIQFGFIKNQADNFKIELKSSIEGLLIYLTDLKTNTDQNLSINPVYNFTSSEGDDANRFLLHFSPLGIKEAVDNDNISINLVNEQINIVTTKALYADIRVTNILGQNVLDGKTNGNILTILDANSLQNGVYIVTLFLPQKVLSKKILFYR